MSEEIQIDTAVGRFAGIDFSGGGPDVLLVHQFTANAQTWASVASPLREICHPVAVDLRGHGRTEAAVDGADGPRGRSRARRRGAGHAPASAAHRGQRPAHAVRGGSRRARPVGRGQRGDRLRLAGARRAGLVRRTLGSNEVNVWVDRFGVFASGSADEKADYLERTVARACQDWLVAGVSPEHCAGTARRRRRCGRTWVRSAGPWGSAARS